MTDLPPAVSLAALKPGMKGRVVAVLDDPQPLGEDAEATVAMRLIEIGFVPGEPVEIIAEARPGGDPMAVRIGGSCFALRRREAAAVQVQAEET
ncbi:MAG: FeoA family protein [Steroidobacteraceae bacterium]